MAVLPSRPTITDLSRALRSREVSSRELTAEALQRAASEQLKDVDPAKPLAEVPGGAEVQSKVQGSFDSLTKLFKCS